MIANVNRPLAMSTSPRFRRASASPKATLRPSFSTAPSIVISSPVRALERKLTFISTVTCGAFHISAALRTEAITPPRGSCSQ